AAQAPVLPTKTPAAVDAPQKARDRPRNPSGLATLASADGTPIWRLRRVAIAWIEERHFPDPAWRHSGRGDYSPHVSEAGDQRGESERAQRRAARKTIAAYHEEQLRLLLER